jgi:hypothetical protein
VGPPQAIAPGPVQAITSTTSRFPISQVGHSLNPRAQPGALSPADVAVQLGHTDGGRLVMTLYGHPNEDRARDRLDIAFAADGHNSAAAAERLGHNSAAGGDGIA